MTDNRFMIGWNMPGYLPEMDPYMVVGADDAKRAMIDELLRSADHADEIENHEIAEELSALAEELNLSDVSQGWDATVDNLAYWITPTDEEPTDDI